MDHLSRNPDRPDDQPPVAARIRARGSSGCPIAAAGLHADGGAAPLRHDDDAAQGELALIEAESTVRGARELSEALFQDIKGKREYQQALGTREQAERFTRELTRRAGLLNKLLGLELSDAVVEAVAGRLARRVVAWKHDSSSQRKRQELAVAARRKKMQDRDRDILQYAAMKLSQRDIARMVQVPRTTVQRVLRRHSTGD